MSKPVRTAMYLICAVQLLGAVALFLQLPFVVKLWPFEGTTPLTFIFVASILAAAAASQFWAVASGHYGALAGIGLDYLFIFLPVSIRWFQLGASGGNSTFTLYGIECAIGALFGLALFLWSVRIPIDRSIPMPGLVSWSFVVFIVALVAVSTRLLLRHPNVIPWRITPELSTVIGLMFVGAAAYFVYALLRPSWFNSAGQLAGFLAYDLVLIVPFLTRLPTVAPAQKLGLTIYTAVVIYSGLLAFFFLFLWRPTRVWARQPA